MTYVNDHRNLSTSSEIWLEQSRQFWIPVWNDLVFSSVFDHLIVPDSFNTPTQNQEWSVNVTGFFLTLSCIHGFLDSFTASQITKGQHAHPSHMWSVFVSYTNHLYCKNTVTSAGVMIESENIQKSYVKMLPRNYIVIFTWILFEWNNRFIEFKRAIQTYIVKVS